jgi:hypothetical protein
MRTVVKIWTTSKERRPLGGHPEGPSLRERSEVLQLSCCSNFGGGRRRRVSSSSFTSRSGADDQPGLGRPHDKPNGGLQGASTGSLELDGPLACEGSSIIPWGPMACRASLATARSRVSRSFRDTAHSMWVRKVLARMTPMRLETKSLRRRGVATPYRRRETRSRTGLPAIVTSELRRPSRREAGAGRTAPEVLADARSPFPGRGQ